MYRDVEEGRLDKTKEETGAQFRLMRALNPEGDGGIAPAF